MCDRFNIRSQNTPLPLKPGALIDSLQIMSVVESAALSLGKADKLTGGHLAATKSAIKLLCLVLEIQVSADF